MLSTKRHDRAKKVVVETLTVTAEEGASRPDELVCGCAPRRCRRLDECLRRVRRLAEFIEVRGRTGEVGPGLHSTSVQERSAHVGVYKDAPTVWIDFEDGYTTALALEFGLPHVDAAATPWAAGTPPSVQPQRALRLDPLAPGPPRPSGCLGGQRYGTTTLRCQHR